MSGLLDEIETGWTILLGCLMVEGGDMEHVLTRRRLFESAAALGALAMVSGCAPKMEETEPVESSQEVVDMDAMEVKHSWCYMCGPAKVLCSTLCYIDDTGKWVHV